jgi:predicted aconitase with swiveling domain
VKQLQALQQTATAAAAMVQPATDAVVAVAGVVAASPYFDSIS